MSLTRIEWEEMWIAVKRIENATCQPAMSEVTRRRIVKTELAVLKEKIQAVIGQQE